MMRARAAFVCGAVCGAVAALGPLFASVTLDVRREYLAAGRGCEPTCRCNCGRPLCGCHIKPNGPRADVCRVQPRKAGKSTFQAKQSHMGPWWDPK